MKVRKSIILIALLVLLASLVAACGGDDDSEETEDMPTMAATFNADEAGQEGPPGVETANASPDGDGSASGPPFGDGSAPPGIGSSSGGDASQEVVTDFSALTVGDVVTVRGAVSMPDSALPTAIITDSEGNELVLAGFPTPLLAGMNGRETQLSGEIGEAGEDGRLVLNGLAASSGPGSSGLPFDPNASVEGFIPTGSEVPNFDSVAGAPSDEIEITQLDLQIDMSLTALQIHDEIVSAEGNRLTGAELLMIIGNPEAGWEFRYQLAETGEVIAYMVSPGGTVSSMPSSAAVGPVGNDLVPIEVSRVVVDTDALVEIVNESQDESVPSGFPALFVLRADEDGGIMWSIEGPLDLEPVDATVAQ